MTDKSACAGLFYAAAVDQLLRKNSQRDLLRIKLTLQKKFCASVPVTRILKDSI
jgi:hypothetical protein